MARQQILDLRGGLNLRDATDEIPANELTGALDVVPYGYGGGLVNRADDTQLRDFTSDSSPIGGVKPLAALDAWEGAGVLLVYTGQGRVMAYVPSGAATQLYDPGAGGVDPVSAGFFNAVVAPASGGQGPLYFRARNVGGGNVYMQSAGGAAAAWTAASGTLPNKAAWFLYAGNRVWAAGIAPGSVILAADDSRIQFSDLGDPRAWPAANTLQLSPQDGRQFTGFGTYGPYVFAFKRDKAWVIYDLDTGANRPLGQDSGALNQGTVIPTPEGLVFIDPNSGPMITDGSSVRPLPNGDKIGQATWGSFEEAVYVDQLIIFRTADAAPNNGLVCVYDMRSNAWWPFSFHARGLAVLADVLYAINSTSTSTIPGVWKVGRDASGAVGAVNPQIVTSSLALGDKMIRKRVRAVEAFIPAGALNATPVVDGVLGAATLLDPAGTLVPPRLATVGVCNTLQMRFAGVGGQFALTGFAVDFMARAR